MKDTPDIFSHEGKIMENIDFKYSGNQASFMDNSVSNYDLTALRILPFDLKKRNEGLKYKKYDLATRNEPQKEQEITKKGRNENIWVQK